MKWMKPNSWWQPLRMFAAYIVTQSYTNRKYLLSPFVKAWNDQHILSILSKARRKYEFERLLVSFIYRKIWQCVKDTRNTFKIQISVLVAIRNVFLKHRSNLRFVLIFGCELDLRSISCSNKYLVSLHTLII